MKRHTLPIQQRCASSGTFLISTRSRDNSGSNLRMHTAKVIAAPPRHRPTNRTCGGTALRIPESEQLSIHIDALWNQIRAHKKYLLELKKSLTVDVFLGYRSNCDHAGVAVPHTSLEMFRELEIPFELSIIT